MEKWEKTSYILRFREGNEIKTINFEDLESATYLINKLENESKQFVLIVEKNKGLRRDVKALLDFTRGLNNE